MAVVDIPVIVSLLLMFLLAGVAFLATGIALIGYRGTSALPRAKWSETTRGRTDRPHISPMTSESAWEAKPSRLVPMAVGMISMGLMFTLYLVGLIVL